jgi:hypothetical protein
MLQTRPKHIQHSSAVCAADFAVGCTDYQFVTGGRINGTGGNIVAKVILLRVTGRRKRPMKAKSRTEEYVNPALSGSSGRDILMTVCVKI